MCMNSAAGAISIKISVKRVINNIELEVQVPHNCKSRLQVTASSHQKGAGGSNRRATQTEQNTADVIFFTYFFLLSCDPKSDNPKK